MVIHQKPAAVRQISTLTALTRLELVEYTGVTRHAAHLRSLPLRELILVDCHKLVLDIFVPGALTSLEKLHLVGMQRNVMRDSLLELQDCAEAVLSLPHLVQLSGSNALFREEGMASALSTWQQHEYTKGLMSANDFDHELSLMNLWLRRMA